MKRIASLTVAAAAGGLLVLAAAQIAPAQDPVEVNAKTIRLKLENSRVRVLEARLQPGEKEQMHSHPAYVTYVLSGGMIRNHGADGKTTEATISAGEVIYRDGLTHWAENIGSTPIHIILVELKNPG